MFRSFDERHQPWLIYVAALALALGASPAYGHHSFAAIYDGERQITLEGVVIEFLFINPHPFLLIRQGGSGIVQRWRLEMDNRFELVDIGMRDDTFQPGDRVVVTGHPGRAQEQILYLRSLIRPSDGFRYRQIGSTPEIDRFRPEQ